MNAEVGDALSEDAELRVKYVLNDYHCGSAKRVNTVRDWLSSFGIPERDEFFLEWSRLLLSVGKAAYSLREGGKQAELDALWDWVFFYLYLNYEIGGDFAPQFEANRKEIERYLADMTQQSVETE